MTKRDIVVVGTSAGGIEALTRLAGQLPADFPAAVLAVVHIAPGGPSCIAEVIGRATALRARLGKQGQTIAPGHIYFAPPDRHMTVGDGHIRLDRGRHENRARPAIDPLFRSAAVTFGPRAIGIILSGCLDDGTAGLSAIKRCGGVAMVQDPEDAAYPDMPRKAMQTVDVTYALSVARMGSVLIQLTGEQVSEKFTVPPDLASEVAMYNGNSSDAATETERLDGWGRLVALGCPECGGPIWERRQEEPRRYRCRIGHAFTANALIAEQREKSERGLWEAVRVLEEEARMLATLAEDEQQSGKHWMLFAERSAETREKIQVLRSLLENSPESVKKG
jgi:two-component system, chemotaxis family, protein-glutamate methylesterase/glutaminase